MASSSSNSKPRWLPLEANPEVMNKYVDGLGVGNSFQFCDVFGLDPDLLMMIPQPCAALVMLFPITDRVLINCVGIIKTFFIVQSFLKRGRRED
ncbi:PREDICTED: ubiquitin carboxyl-terminal hydrolase-like [Amphimedon queenslandica]|uniref:Ubiquitin carboxyl-terminal hydrolase n=1 Tax=Amphimedon queenslandica TaxID=400682 RepID=A0AAN0JMP7_AMPQE|nr:PREDICTED: ubiquitin carboxyl-terminal hydrolase-like [Amphimedon queenslandica]|eukprot:XP_019858088.1 PREDICTED: ubiquitin carboxyl-terminal hydrolase-like [Amphimedon queenslandica]